jgi:hypothetical protein
MAKPGSGAALARPQREIRFNPGEGNNMNRWRTITVAAFAAVALTGASSQVSAQGLTIGFKLGPTFANLEFDDETFEENTINNFGGGGFIRFGIGGLAIQPELLVFTKGSDVESTLQDFETKIDYLEIPVLLHFSLGSAVISPYLAAGPSFGFEIGCKVEDDAAGTESDCDDAGSGFNVNRKSFDFSLTGLAGLGFRMGPGSLFVEGRYVHGLSNINDQSGAEVKNRAYAVMAGYSISLGR